MRAAMRDDHTNRTLETSTQTASGMVGCVVKFRRRVAHNVTRPLRDLGMVGKCHGDSRRRHAGEMSHIPDRHP